MANGKEKRLFRHSALSRIRSAEELDTALSVSNPSAWIVVSAFLVLALGLVVWSFFAVVPITTTTVALTEGGRSATCWMDADMVQQLSSPDVHVSIAGKEATNYVVETRPRSSAEVVNSLDGSYLAEGLDLKPWSYRVNLEFAEPLYAPEELGDEKAILAPVRIVMREEHPIALVFVN